MVAVVDDRRVVGVRGYIGIELRDLACVRGNEILDLLLGHQNIVGCDTGLAGIGQLAIGDTPCSVSKGVAALDDNGRLPAELKSDRDQVVAGRAHDRAAHRRTSSEENVIERQRGERDADIRVAGHDCHLILPERSANIDVINSAVAGVNSDGLIMARLPAASAVASGINARATG